MSRLRLKQLAQDGASIGDVVTWDGTAWVPQAPSGGGGGGGITPSYVSARRSAALTWATGTYAAIQWDAEDSDTSGYHSTTSNTSRLVAPATGVYLVGASVTASGTGAIGVSRVLFTVLRNGSTSVGLTNEHTLPAIASGVTFYPDLATSGLVNLTAGDYLEVWYFQNTGVTLTLNNAESGFFMNRIA